jgi:hypothetical protein
MILVQAGTVMDAGQITLGCGPNTNATGAPIINKTLCACDMWVRFIIGGNDHTGQFAAKIGHWKKH